MESRFDITDFEDTLKDYADKFTLTPSKRVWKGIYNDLHPGSKWPSLGIGVVFVITMLWMGFSSDNSAQKRPVTTAPVQNEFKMESEKSFVPQTGSTTDFKVTDEATTLNESAVLNLPSGITPEYIPDQALAVINDQILVNKAPPINNYSNSFMTSRIVAEKLGLTSETELSVDPEIVRIQKYLSAKPSISANVERDSSPKSTASPDNKVLTELSTLKKKKSENKVSWNFFVTPSVTSVYFKGHNLQEPQSSIMPGVVVRPALTEHAMTTNARIGFQLGSDVQYAFSDKFKLFSGMRLSYAGYNILTSYVHPTIAKLTLQKSNGSIFTRDYLSYYGDGGNFGDIVLHNYSIQFAIPVGMQWQVWSNEDIKLSVAPSIEPFVVLKNQAYVLSSNGRNFINDPSLMRTLNLNGNLGTFISFSARDIDWKIGPTVQYQFLSTYRNIYPVKEHLLHYGLSIGISK